MKNKVIDILKQLYDPEFPIIDIYTLGLIYNVKVSKTKNLINITMTFTTPECPMADNIVEMIQEEIKSKLPNFKTVVEITFEPLWSPEKIKDKDLRQMFK